MFSFVPSGCTKLTVEVIFYYLGLNHVIRKFAEPLEHMANILIPVPGGSDGPSGVLICAENYIIYKNVGEQGDIKIPIPRRMNDLEHPDRGNSFSVY